jgi:hypothetical protein
MDRVRIHKAHAADADIVAQFTAAAVREEGGGNSAFGPAQFRRDACSVNAILMPRSRKTGMAAPNRPGNRQ